MTNFTLSRTEQAFQNIFYSPKIGMRVSRWLLIGMVIFLGIQRLGYLLLFLDINLAYEDLFIKDFLADYVVAVEVLAGGAPYQPVNILMEAMFGKADYFPHPLPHPPPGVLVSLPFGYLEPGAAIVLWFLLQLGFIGGLIVIIMRLLNIKVQFYTAGLIFLALLGWHPFTEDLLYGNFSILMLLLVITAWYAQKKNKEILAGVLLGLAVGMKIIFWPFLFFFMLKRKFRLVISAGMTIFLFNAAAGLVIGFEPVFNYYLKVSAQIIPLYRTHPYNFSLSSVGWRLFYGTISQPYLPGVESGPLFYQPELALVTSLALPILVFILVIRCLMRSEDIDLAYATLACVSLLISPTYILPHYYVLALIPVAVIGKRLAERKMPDRESIVFGLTTVILLMPVYTLVRLVQHTGGNPVWINDVIVVPFYASLWLMLPPVALLGLLFLLCRFMQKSRKELGV